MSFIAAVAAIAALILIMSTCAQAQDKPLTGPEEIAQKKREEAAEVEKAYKNTLKNTRSDTAATNADPWGSIRPNQAPNPPGKNPR
jgi:hypothetical protein